MNEKVIKAIIEAYEGGITLEAISQLFRIEQHSLINIIHAYKIGRRSCQLFGQ